jgi:hypothetical protein
MLHFSQVLNLPLWIAMINRLIDYRDPFLLAYILWELGFLLLFSLLTVRKSKVASFLLALKIQIHSTNCSTSLRKLVQNEAVSYISIKSDA